MLLETMKHPFLGMNLSLAAAALFACGCWDRASALPVDSDWSADQASVLNYGSNNVVPVCGDYGSWRDRDWWDHDWWDHGDGGCNPPPPQPPDDNGGPPCDKVPGGGASASLLALSLLGLAGCKKLRKV